MENIIVMETASLEIKALLAYIGSPTSLFMMGTIVEPLDVEV